MKPSEPYRLASRNVRFSLGFNHDPELISRLRDLNRRYEGKARIDEVFGSLPDAPLSSARPTSRLPCVPWEEFSHQVKMLGEAGIRYNFLLNTACKLTREKSASLGEYLTRLRSIGVERLTLGTPELCRFVRDRYPEFHITLSITYGTDSVIKLVNGERSGADAIYLQPVTVNRDFGLLRTLIRASNCECRLYANVSCISGCPVVRQHYELFASQAKKGDIAQANDLFFAGCSLVKLNNPVEWIQMPWIRPEDIRAYMAEGIRHFKLSDRLASTSALFVIAEAYMAGKSPPDLFSLIERDGSKFRLLDGLGLSTGQPIVVDSSRIPNDFIEHFRRGQCISQNCKCLFCKTVADLAVSVCCAFDKERHLTQFSAQIPRALQSRAAA